MFQNLFGHPSDLWWTCLAHDWDMGVCPKPFVIKLRIRLFTFPHVPITFLHVPPWFSKRFVVISYIPIRSVSTVPQKRENLYLNHTFLYVLCRQSPGNGKIFI